MSQDMKDEVSELCSTIIVREMQKVYPNIWQKMALMENHPWNLEHCLQIFKKYWMSVFSFHLKKQCITRVGSFMTFLEQDFSGLYFARLSAVQMAVLDFRFAE